MIYLPPYFKHDDICEYHDGSPGYTTNDYKAFKYMVQELIDKKVLSFVDVPNMVDNPLSG